ncbi:lytic transglycosylase domain-containing protein [Streptomyces sp. NPDC017991]|uniref:lytic transglycosylase domain-containing protein n=1 Tax=Streptomyces sp. NPDC017991 TaxID=3365026 RepID=UPI0037ADDD17
MADEGGGQAQRGTTTVIMAAVGGCGCLALPAGFALTAIVVIIIGGLAVLLLPLVVVVLFFLGLPTGGGGQDDLSPAERRCDIAERALGSEPEAQADRVQSIFLGDGKGNLELSLGGAGEVTQPCTVPFDLLESINTAGSVCDTIGPVTVAAQIQYETAFDAGFVGPNGAEGISQVPADVFAELKADGDPLDAEQSIEVQGQYLCNLADEAQELLDSGQATGSALDLALAAYDVGMDAVREAGGVPATEDSQSYVIGVRTWFAPMEGVGPPPRTIPPQGGLLDVGPDPEETDPEAGPGPEEVGTDVTAP